MRRLSHTLVSLSLACLAGPAAAAPQALMIAAGGGETHLSCSAGACSAEITTFCLQPERPNPEPGQRYDVLAVAGQGDSIRLVGRTREGKRIVLPIESNAVISAERNHSAVVLTVPEPVLREHGLHAISVEVSRPVMLTPRSAANDANPQTEDDLKFLASTANQVAGYVIDDHTDEIGATRIVRDVMNGVPVDRQSLPAERRAAWTGAEPERETPAAQSMARDAYESCEGFGDAYDPKFYGFRACMGVMHDEIIDEVNDAYADLIKAGS